VCWASMPQGAKFLTFVPGTVVHPDNYHFVATQTGLQRVGRLIRAYHTAVASFAATDVDVWQADGRDPTGTAEVLCHNDLASWNLIVTPGEWVFIDWDLAAPGRILWDLALAAYTFVRMWPDQQFVVSRYHAFCAGYGLATADQRGLLHVIVERTARMATILLEHAANGDQPYVRLVHEGHAASWQAASAHVQKHLTGWLAQLPV
jgi:thiamine kinase-like enzyme